MQFVIVIVCCLTNIADGADIAALAFAAPVLIQDWGLRPAVMGSLFGATATGLAIGAFLIAPLSDKIGRRPIMLIATATLAITMLSTPYTTNVTQLAMLRFITGAGLGTLGVSLNVVVSEFTNEKWRNPLVALLHTGFSIGTMTGGLFAALLLEPYGWRAMFYATGAMNIVTFLLVLFLVPETPSYLIQRADSRSLGALNKVMRRINQPALETLPTAVARSGKAMLAALLGAGRRNSTLLLWGAQFSFSLISYLLLNWKPTVLVNAGLTPGQAGIAGLIGGFAGIAGHMIVGFLSTKGREVKMTIIFFLMLCGSLLLFGLLPPAPWSLIATASMTTFCNVGCMTGLLLIAINHYPGAVRTASVAAMVGIARLGAISGPLFGGLLLELGYPRATMFAVLAVISLLPILAMFLMARAHKPEAEPA
jgi:MFS family permease